MKIIIAGAGEVGFHLAKLLSYESQDITLIDTDKAGLQYADNSLDIKTLKGDATSISILQEAKVSQSDLVIGVTSSETTNITFCVIAKQLGCKRSIARISNTEFISRKDDVKFHELGIDELISPEQLAAKEIELLMSQSAFNDTYEFDEGALTLVGVIMPKNAPFVGKSVKEAAQTYSKIHFMPIAIQRKGTHNTLIPRGDTVFSEGDQVYFITCDEGVNRLYSLLGKAPQKLKKVMILGGSKIGIKTAMSLSEIGFKTKLIEQYKDKAYELADMLPDTLIINGDGRNVEILKEENLDTTDAFIAVTGDAETNMMACMVAKSHGVKKTIALVENMDYYELSHTVGVDTLINKKLLAANTIFRHVRRGEIVALMRLNNMTAEILEFIVKPESLAAHKRIKEIDFPREAVIGGIIREGEGKIVLGDFEIKPGDHIVVCCLPSAIKEVEKVFF